jgi:hypothetical protein
MARHPSGWFYLLGIFLVIGGCGASVYRGFSTIPETIHKVAKFPRAIFPGEAEMQLPAGDLTLYAETKSMVDRVVVVSGGISDLRCQLRDVDGKPVEIRLGGMNEKYSFGGYDAQSIGHLTAPAAGTYRLSCTGAEGSQAVLAIGNLGFFGLVVDLGGPALAGFLLGITTIIAVFFMRRRQRM